jgi:hypothetical protein
MRLDVTYGVVARLTHWNTGNQLGMVIRAEEDEQNR